MTMLSYSVTQWQNCELTGWPDPSWQSVLWSSSGVCSCGHHRWGVPAIWGERAARHLVPHSSPTDAPWCLGDWSAWLHLAPASCWLDWEGWGKGICECHIVILLFLVPSILRPLNVRPHNMYMVQKYNFEYYCVFNMFKLQHHLRILMIPWMVIVVIK